MKLKFILFASLPLLITISAFLSACGSCASNKQTRGFLNGVCECSSGHCPAGKSVKNLTDEKCICEKDDTPGPAVPTTPQQSSFYIYNKDIDLNDGCSFQTQVNAHNSSNKELEVLVVQPGKEKYWITLPAAPQFGTSSTFLGYGKDSNNECKLTNITIESYRFK